MYRVHPVVPVLTFATYTQVVWAQRQQLEELEERYSTLKAQHRRETAF